MNQFLELVFAMFISILLGMGMPNTAVYAVAASVVAPGLIEIGFEPLFAHMFVFYFSVMSAITPPVVLAAYAAAGVAKQVFRHLNLEEQHLLCRICLFIVLPSLGWGDEGRIILTAVTATEFISYRFLSQGWFSKGQAGDCPTPTWSSHLINKHKYLV